MTPPDAEKTSTKDGFESELHRSNEGVRANNGKNATLFYQERKPNFHKNPESCEDNHSTTIHSCPVIQARIFVYLLM